jgi:hypothetical protein
MKKLYFFILLFFITTASFASHIIGYEMCLVNIKNTSGQPTNMYKVRVRFYRDASGVSIPSIFSFYIKKNSDNTIINNIPGLINGRLEAPKINPTTFLTYDPNDCPPKGFSGQKIEYGFYESSPINLTPLNDPAGYYLSFNTTGRNPGILNTWGGPGNSASYSITLTMDFPRLDATAPYQYNSSPEFKYTPLQYFCVGKLYTLDWSAHDADGDSLVYSTTLPLDGVGTKPWATNVIPYDSWNGYKLDSNIMDGNPDISIDSSTGMVVLRPTKVGKYLIAIKCEEYRNGVKIGEIRRESQVEATICNEFAPVIDVDKNDTLNIQGDITDTVYFGQTDFSLLFTAKDNNDSVSMEYVQNHGDNLIVQGASFGQPNNPGLQFLIEEVDSVKGEFRWVPDCNDIRIAPYKFDIVAHDKTCPVPFYDTTHVTLYVRSSFVNIPPVFVSPDTMANGTVLTYFVQAGEKFNLNGSRILKAIDDNTNQNVVIKDIPDSNDPSNFKNEYIFNSVAGMGSATATFEWIPACARIRPDTAYRITFIAYNNDCNNLSDTATMHVDIFVIPALNEAPVMTVPLSGDVEIYANDLFELGIKVVDTINQDSNTYRYVTVGALNDDFSSFNVVGGAMVNFPNTSGMDSTYVVFSWIPNYANVREEQYILNIHARDNGCPDSLSVIQTIRIRVVYPFGIKNDISSLITVYPNPASDRLLIDAENKLNINSVNIMDMQGRKLIDLQKMNENNIDVSDLTEGMYLLKLNTDKGSAIKKITILR